MAVFPTDKPRNLERAFLIGVQTHDMQTGEGAELLGELKELVENLRLTIVDSALVNLRTPTPALLLGSGKAQELADAAKAAQADVIVFDAATVGDLSTYEDGSVLATGMEHVAVNGTLVLRDRKRTKATPGRGLRRG